MSAVAALSAASRGFVPSSLPCLLRLTTHTTPMMITRSLATSTTSASPTTSSTPNNSPSSSAPYVPPFERQNSATAWTPELANICTSPPLGTPFKVMPVIWGVCAVMVVLPTYWSLKETNAYYKKFGHLYSSFWGRYHYSDDY
eukprot:GHVS01020823.1.p1 GENE.GHVS01020823.1~~GHVS01020823.1.p1  ORF type:complete len:143 (+),score=17.78 GHVS01020823.1:158-586(+)